jgi:hypothetical protein
MSRRACPTASIRLPAAVPGRIAVAGAGRLAAAPGARTDPHPAASAAAVTAANATVATLMPVRRACESPGSGAAGRASAHRPQ